MNTLGYALLSLLTHKPRTGYQLARLMQAPIGYMWTAQHSQIYPQLSELEQSGLIRFQASAGRGPRDNKLYTLTPAGRAALRRWVDSPLTPRPNKSELMLRVRCLWMISAKRAQAFIDGVRLEVEHRLATLKAEELEFDPHDVLDPASREFSAYATLRWGLAYEQAMLNWCDWLLASLAEGASVTPRPSPGTGAPR
jgi:DNA-binding PadR family transcriptional regulator